MQYVCTAALHWLLSLQQVIGCSAQRTFPEPLVQLLVDALHESAEQLCEPAAVPSSAHPIRL